jgi:hypothetical protein
LGVHRSGTPLVREFASRSIGQIRRTLT